MREDEADMELFSVMEETVCRVELCFNTDQTFMFSF